jgi:HAE1 family hydrophobic/amphiphilic exporter-1
MKITEIAVRRGVTFIMIYLIAVGFGLFSLMRLKIDLFPKLEFPIMAIITQYTGVGPQDIETVVTRPIEETVASVENVETITSISRQGVSLIILEFDWDTDMDQAEDDVRTNLEFIEDILPPDITDPLIFGFDLSMQPILYFSVNSNLHGLAELRHISEHEIEPRLERIAGVASAYTMGGLQREIRIVVDPARLRAHNLSIQQVSSALQQNNLQLPSGFIENEQQEFTIQTAGEYTSIAQIENTNIATINGSSIRIKDVADVVDGFKEVRQGIWANDKPAVMLMVQRQSDANTVNVARAVMKNLDKIREELPEGVELDVFFNQADFISRSMSNLGNTAMQAIVLAFLVLLFFLRNVRSSLITAVAIPISIILTFAVMDQAGVTLNMISMAGLALAVGLLVDNSIVVLESIFRYHESGERPQIAANKGASEVSMAITASTLTTLAVFLPILFVPGISGELFKDMGLTICFSLAVSLVVALTLIPLLSSRLLAVIDIKRKRGFWNRIAKIIEGWTTKLFDNYSIALKWALGHRKTIVFSTLGLFILSMVILIGRGGEFMPQHDEEFISITVERSPGISLQQMEKTVRQINTIIHENVPEAELIFSNFGRGEGVMALFSTSASSEGEVSIKLPKVTQRDRSMFEIQDVLREKFKNIPDATISFQESGFGAMFGAGDIVVQIIGHNLDVAGAIAEELQRKVEKIEGVVFTETSVEKARPELKIDLDRQRIADLGISTAQVGSVVSTSILGTVVTRYREGGDEYDVRVQFAKEARTSKEDLENILIMTPTGRQIPLRAVANIEYTKAPQEINREDQERYVSVNIDISGRDLRSVTADVNKIIKEVAIPNDFRIEIGGQAEEQQESFFYLAIAMLVAILLTYMVMASQFESFVDPFIILFTIPLSFIGVALGLLVTGTIVSVMVFVGVIMLVGIVVNNGIVLIDYINQLRARGEGLFEAIQQGGRVRIRPVLMTALTTILAMLPLALGLGESGEAWAPMARAVMGGLLVATVLTLIVVPVIYAIMELLAEKVKAKRAAKLKAKLAKLAPEQA